LAIRPASGVFVLRKINYSTMKSKNNSIFHLTRHRSDVSIAMKSSQTKHGAPAIATTAHYVFGANM